MLHYCRQGNLQAVLDEQRHLLLGSALVVPRTPARTRPRAAAAGGAGHAARSGWRRCGEAQGLGGRPLAAGAGAAAAGGAVTLLDRAGVDVARLRNWRRVFATGDAEAVECVRKTAHWLDCYRGIGTLVGVPEGSHSAVCPTRLDPIAACLEAIDEPVWVDGHLVQATVLEEGDIQRTRTSLAIQRLLRIELDVREPSNATSASPILTSRSVSCRMAAM